MSNKPNARQTTRDLLLGKSKHFKRKTVVFDDVEIDVKEPSVKERAKIVQMSMADVLDAAGNPVIDKDTKQPKREMSPILLLGNAAFILAYVKDTDERLFESGDAELLFDGPYRDMIDEIGQAAVSLMNVETDVKAAEKNSKATPTN